MDDFVIAGLWCLESFLMILLITIVNRLFKIRQTKERKNHISIVLTNSCLIWSADFEDNNKKVISPTNITIIRSVLMIIYTAVYSS